MQKKLIVACMAVAAFAAFVVFPATSSALELTHPTGTRLAVGAKLTGTNIGNTVMTTSSGNIECSTAVITGELTKNNGTEVEGSITSASFTGTGGEGRCTGPINPKVTTTGAFNGIPWCMKLDNNAEMTATVRGNSCANAARSITFVFDVPLIGECKYERTTATGPVKGTYTTHPTDAIVHVSEQEFAPEAGNPFGCPGAGKLDMSFTVETDVATPTPIYIS